MKQTRIKTTIRESKHTQSTQREREREREIKSNLLLAQSEEERSRERRNGQMRDGNSSDLRRGVEEEESNCFYFIYLPPSSFFRFENENNFLTFYFIY